tara:strand:+ start:189 stop:398 length:210 start_codon:yes stop_codon:yes gene_type:complete
LDKSAKLLAIANYYKDTRIFYRSLDEGTVLGSIPDEGIKTLDQEHLRGLERGLFNAKELLQLKIYKKIS